MGQDAIYCALQKRKNNLKGFGLKIWPVRRRLKPLTFPLRGTLYPTRTGQEMNLSSNQKLARARGLKSRTFPPQRDALSKPEIKKLGPGERTRTSDLLLRRQPLYPLSYARALL